MKMSARSAIDAQMTIRDAQVIHRALVFYASRMANTEPDQYEDDAQAIGLKIRDQLRAIGAPTTLDQENDR